MELCFFLGRTGDHKLAGVFMRDVVPATELVGQSIAFDAVTRLEGTGRVVDPGVDDTAVPAASGQADPRQLLQKKDVGEMGCQFGGNGATHHAAAHDDNVRSFHR